MGKKDKQARPTPTLPDMSPDTRKDEKTDVVRGQSSVKHPPPPDVNAVDGLDEVTQIILRSFMVVACSGRVGSAIVVVVKEKEKLHKTRWRR